MDRALPEPFQSAPGPPALVVTLHDVAPQTWDACEHLLAAVTAVASIPITLLVVPDYHGAGLRTFSPAYRNGLESRLARGDELALHGWHHLDDEPLGWDPIERLRRTLLTAREGEFAALPVARARERLEAGLDWFGRFGWPLHGFVAPAWLMSPGTWQALDGLPFGYVTTRPSIYLMPQRLPFETGTLVYSVRTSWRRALSLLWNEALRRRLRAQPLVRIALHPADAAHPSVVRWWQHALESLLCERTAVTKAQLATRLRSELPAALR